MSCVWLCAKEVGLRLRRRLLFEAAEAAAVGSSQLLSALLQASVWMQRCQEGTVGQGSTREASRGKQRSGNANQGRKGRRGAKRCGKDREEKTKIAAA